MKRFESLNEIGTHAYRDMDLAAMTDEGLVAEINRLNEWDADLLADLIWRAFPDFDETWEVGDAACYEAAEKLGFKI